jgi:hypothetical protein
VTSRKLLIAGAILIRSSINGIIVSIVIISSIVRSFV